MKSSSYLLAQLPAARQFVEVTTGTAPLNVDSKQALAAIGQHKLMGIYDEVFSSFGLKVAQCLLVHRDFESEVARTNVKNTIHKLLEFGYTPIINENDTVAVDEIVLGDNDKLSALVAVNSEADLLVLASDINGLYNQNPYLNEDAQLINEVRNVEEVLNYIEEKESALGTGGMTTKIHAAMICRKHNIEMWIVNGGRNGFLVDALAGEIDFTKFSV